MGSVLVTATAIIIFSVKIAIAGYYAAGETPEGLARAEYLEPYNPKYPYLLAHYWHYSLQRHDLGQAMAYYHRALALSPHSAKIWMDLAAAREESGELEKAQEAYAAAVVHYPASAEVAWQYGNFLLRQGDFANAFANISRAVKIDHTLATAAISTCWRANPDIELILDRALPELRPVYLDAMQFLTNERAANAALAVWKRLIQIGGKLELSESFALIDVLVEQDRIEEARRIWQASLVQAGVAESSYFDGSVIWDGGFEGNFIDGGFGWRKIDSPEIRFDFDEEIKHSGNRSLRVTFDGRENLNFYHLSQRVPVDPQTTYELSAYLRTEEITTNNGLRLAVSDPRGLMAGDMTPQLTGTQPWTNVKLSFTTDAETHVVTVTLIRIRSEKFDNKLAGTVWIDDVSLKPTREKRSAR